MSGEILQSIAAYVAIATPVTVTVIKLARVWMEWLRQRHRIRSAHVQMSHKITTHYLDRALDPNVPLAIRHQLLRFLATPDTNGSRLSSWAQSELKRVGGIVDETNRAVASAEVELQRAKTASELAAAERKLADAVRRQRSLLEAPEPPPVTAAALRAGLIETKDLSGLSMKGEDLCGMTICYRKIRSGDFSGAKLRDSRLQGCDLRAAIFVEADLYRTVFHDADLRGADFSGSDVTEADFSKARLEGADMRCESLEKARLGATYDKLTKWPEGFDPVAAGAVLVGGGESTEESKGEI